jgi:hypothetical protein
MKKNFLWPQFRSLNCLRFIISIILIINTGILFAEDPESAQKNISRNSDSFIRDQNEQPQQELRITGKVSDSDGTPLPGANILLSGTYKGVISKIDGFYEITVPSAESVLEFSYVGFVKQLVTVGDQAIINVVLLPDPKTISEVVVVGYPGFNDRWAYARPGKRSTGITELRNTRW